MGKMYRVCSRCVMDTSDPEIEFDAEGHCNHCNEFLAITKSRAYQGSASDEELQRQVNRIKYINRNADYDCILGISGGVDSCYAAYIAKTLGLRVLAVHMDNGWNAEEAVNNIRNVVQKLKIDYTSYVLDWAEFRDIQLAVLRSSIVEVEIPTDIAILGTTHRLAAKHNVKTIVSGGNFATEGILPNSWFYDPKDLKLLKAIHRRFGTVKMKKFPAFDYKREIYYKLFKKIRMFYILNLVPYKKDEAKSFLMKNLGWKDYGGKHYESRFTGFVQSYYQYKKFNVDYRRATLSTLICQGEISREAALETLEQEPIGEDRVRRETEYIAKKFNLSVSEFQDIMNLPPKSYKDYPNNERLLTMLYSTYQKVFS